MGWAEIKKAVNSNIDEPLNKLFERYINGVTEFLIYNDLLTYGEKGLLGNTTNEGLIDMLTDTTVTGVRSDTYFPALVSVFEKHNRLYEYLNKLFNVSCFTSKCKKLSDLSSIISNQILKEILLQNGLDYFLNANQYALIKAAKTNNTSFRLSLGTQGGSSWKEIPNSANKIIVITNTYAHYDTTATRNAKINIVAADKSTTPLKYLPIYTWNSSSDPGKDIGGGSVIYYDNSKVASNVYIWMNHQQNLITGTCTYGCIFN